MIEKKHRGKQPGFGTIISVGTTTHPAFKIRWHEGGVHRKQGGFKTKTEAAEALVRVRAGLGDGTLVAKHGAAIGFDKVAELLTRFAKEWLIFQSERNLRSHQDNLETNTKPTQVAPLAPLVTIQSAADRLCISTHYIRNLIRQEILPCVRIGKKILLRSRDIDAFIERGGSKECARGSRTGTHEG